MLFRSFKDGETVKKGDLLGTVTGDIRVLLSGERVALNYLQRMSGIATYTKQVSKLLEGSKVTLLDTRKTTPNCRVFEKYAVRIGGGCNHRYNLSEKNIIALKSAGGIVMKMNTQRNVMKCIGATLAVCSAIAMVGGTKSCSAKKTIKKTVNKMADIVDSVTAFM